MNLANLGLAAMNAAQSRLNTAGHNINNADTDGYNRQRVLSTTAGATATGAGYIGRGVLAVTVQRSYDGFLSNQLAQAQTKGAAVVSYGTEVAQVNNLFADRETGIAAALKAFFNGVNAVASEPADPAARQELLGQAGNLVNQINNSNAFLESQRGDINTQITTTVSQVNSYLERVRDLNVQIVKANATATGHAPNDLLDQRDQLVNELGQLVGVKSAEHNDGTISLTIGNGQIVLSGNTVYPLHAVASAADPGRTAIAYSSINSSGGLTPIELQESAITGGSLGGLLTYRAQALDAVQADLGRLAAGLALAVNQLHESGLDANGNAGKAFFSLDDATGIPHSKNQGDGQINVAFSDAAALVGSDYQVSFDGTEYSVKRLSDNTVTTAAAGTTSLTVDGLTFELSGTPQAGDSWVVQPMRKAASSLSLNLEGANEIAVADSTGGSANGNIGLKIAALQTEKVLGNGTTNLTEAYSQIVSKVAVLTQQNATAAKAQAALIEQNYAAQQAVSGVNVDEELIYVDRYLEQFRAASRMIEAASTMFDTLLSLRT